MSVDLNEFLSRNHLEECQHEKGFMFQNPGDSSKQSRIDFIFGSKQLMQNTFQYQSWMSNSDHCALVLCEKPIVNRGPGQWRFSEDVLDNQLFVDAIDKVLHDDSEISDIQLYWDTLKF